MPKIGPFQVMIKPALGLIIVAVVIGFLARPVAHRLPVAGLPSYGYMNPATWRFKTSGGAKAELIGITSAGTVAPIKAARGITWANSDKGFYIHVIRAGATPDTIFLRNVLDYDPTRFPKPTLNLSFEAKSPHSFPIIFMDRAGGPGNDFSAPLWSKQVDVNGDWKTYTVTIPTDTLVKSNNTTTIFSAHLGLQAGQISLRNMHIR